MSGYEDAYKKYYSDAKAKMNIKEVEKVLEVEEVNKMAGKNTDSSVDIYPKKNYLYEDNTKYIEDDTDNKYLQESDKRLNTNEYRGTYRGSYRGIDNYSSVNGNKNSDNYNARKYYGYNSGRDSNNVVQEKKMISKLANRLIFQLVVTLVLFAAVITMKSIPTQESQEVYAACKDVINKNFDYKEFIGDVKTVNIIDEVNKLKVNLKIDDAIKTGTEEVKEKEPTTEKIDDEVDTSSNDSSNTINNIDIEKTN